MSEDIAALMAKDPLDLTRLDLTKIVARLRAARASWIQNGKAPPVTKTREPTADQTAAAEVAGKISFNDLDL